MPNVSLAYLTSSTLMFKILLLDVMVFAVWNVNDVFVTRKVLSPSL